MRTEDEILERTRQLLVDAVSQRVQESQRRCPTNCKYNIRHPLDDRKVVSGEPNPNYNKLGVKTNRTIGLCIYGSEDPTTWNGTVCEHDDDAEDCPHFDPIEKVDDVVAAFKKDILDKSFLEEHYPVIAILRWVLEKTENQDLVDSVDTEKEAPETKAISRTSVYPEQRQLSWWVRSWLYVTLKWKRLVSR